MGRYDPKTFVDLIVDRNDVCVPTVTGFARASRITITTNCGTPALLQK